MGDKSLTTGNPTTQGKKRKCSVIAVLREKESAKCGIIEHFAKVCRSKDTNQNKVFRERQMRRLLLRGTKAQRMKHLQ